ncbi:S-type pyocin domain-containing protein [Pseudomonas sp. zfem002]|uniref:S-type pyocin domain-containing protein n=1 Tax=Pseudomonas sp. zfem002 TaxID=3078197 RepID=UPI002929010E|nr:S-type pyocin domain-containing protein [Pseudomonas sp. zfem002]MDU9390608.1 S-type pyocin domain-containing protein [Pseudomonas sp. zfem002]
MANDNETVYLAETVIHGDPDLRIVLSPGKGDGTPGWGGWGLTEGPKLTAGRPGRLPAGMKSEFVNAMTDRHLVSRDDIDRFYAGQSSTLDAVIEAQINSVKNNAASTAAAGLPQSKARYTGVLEFIRQKTNEHERQVTQANAFWGSSPLYKPSFYMVRSAHEAWKAGRFQNIFAEFEQAYRAAHESIVIDRTLTAATAQLDALSNSIEQHENFLALTPEAKNLALAHKIQRIRAEQLIQFQLLPSTLKGEIEHWAGDVRGLSSVEALQRYRKVMHDLMVNKTSSAPPYAITNPHVKPPLTRTQLDALQYIVEEQQTGTISARWHDYHLSVLLSEYARHLANAHSTFLALENRATLFNHQLNLLNAEAAAHRLAEQQLQEQRLRAAAQARAAVTYAAGINASSLPFISPLGGGSFSINPSTYVALQTAVRLAIPALRLAVLVSGPVLLATIAVGVIALLWPKEQEEPQTAISIPLADLSPPDNLDLASTAISGASVNLPFTPFALSENSRTSLIIAATPANHALGRVPVVAAQYDAQYGVYSVALENPQRVLTWPPVSAPGGGSSTTVLPEHRPEGSVYEGASLSPVQALVESYPALDLIGQDRIIVTFPADSGMAPILVMFRDRRLLPGVATGKGISITGAWLGDATRGGGALVPTQVASQLAGKEFKNFGAFREAFWKAVATDPTLVPQFDKRNISLMRRGKAPKVRKEDRYLSLNTFTLHHQPISEGGGVYDLDNIRIVTPLAHNHIHYGEKP